MGVQTEYRLICDGDECQFRTATRLSAVTLLELSELAGWGTLNGRMYCPLCIAGMIPFALRPKVDSIQAALPDKHD